MKHIRKKRDSRKGEGLPLVRKNGAGYVMTWVIILMVVAAVIIGPFLTFMLTGLRSSHSYADTMAEFYAADSGIEDATYKMRGDDDNLPENPGDTWHYDFTDNAYDPENINGKEVGVDIERLWVLEGLEGTTNLSGGITAIVTTIPVDGTDGFPASGVVRIDDELIQYEDKDDVANEFTVASGGRGYGGTTAAEHDAGAAVSLETIPVLPPGLTVIGQVIDDRVETTLSGDIDDVATVITVASTDGFPLASEELLALIRIDDELIQYQYVDRDNNEIIVFDDVDTPDVDGRGARGTEPASHDMDDASVTAWSFTYQVDFTYDDSEGDISIDRIGVWLPSGVSYVPGSSNVATRLDSLISSSSGTVPVLSTALFPSADVGNPQVMAIEDELIQYEEKDDVANDFTVASGGRGYSDTEAKQHSSGTLVSAEPNQVSYRGGIALEWNIDPAVNFTNLQTVAPPGEGDWQPGAEFPFRRTLAFKFSPAQSPKGIFAWIRTTNPGMCLSWDEGSATYKITSTATDPSSGTHTTLESYVGTSKLTDRVAQVYGDAVAIGNSLMQDLSGSEYIRETLLDDSSASLPDTIPDGASVEAAYLYWSGWQSEPNSISSIVDDEGNILDQDAFEDLVDEVDGADFTVDFDVAGEISYRVTADQVQLLNNTYGWSFSSFKDVTSLLSLGQSATVTLVPRTEANTESVTIINTGGWGSDLDLEVTVLDGPAGGYVTVDGQTILVGDSNDDIDITGQDDLISGDVAGEYTVRVEVDSWSDQGTVDGVAIDGYWWTPTPDSVDVTLTTTVTQFPPEATITKISSSSAEVEITATTIPIGGHIEVNGPEGLVTLDGEGQSDTRTLFPNTLTGGTAETYQVLVTCTSGIVRVTHGSISFPLSADSEAIPDDYTVGDVNADPGQEVWPYQSGQWAYAGWSLIIIYTDPSPEAEPHRLYLYDNFLYANVGSTHIFTISGFQSPTDPTGSQVTCFGGEGDDHYDDDTIEFRAEHDSSVPWNTSTTVKGPLNLENSESPWDNVWNGQSPGFGGLLHEGIDIDTFDVSSLLEEGDTSADIKLRLGEIFNLIYIFVSLPTVPSGAGGGVASLGVITYGYGGE
jgi:hypothetical protein